VTAAAADATGADATGRSASVLEIRGLRAEFHTRHGTVHAVNGVDLTLTAGETHALVGESGSGKSVTAQAICGLLPDRQASVSGEILLDGVNLVRLPERAMRRVRGRDIAMVFQDPSAALDPVRRVGGQVAESLTVHGMGRAKARQRTMDLLGEVGLYNPAQLARRYPFELSGGMKQRVVISAAMAPRPRVLIADEPTTALDATIQEQVLTLLRQMTVEHGTAMLLITHDLAVAARAAQRISVMYGGTIVETGATAVLLSRPRHPYTVGLLGAIPHLRAGRQPLRGVPGEPVGATTEPACCPFAARCQWALSRCWTERPYLAPADADAASGEGPADGYAHLTACWNPVRPDEVAMGRPDRPGFTAASPPDVPTVAPAGEA
jgi:oligopeptide/dipeptide ABC transporter ATP-binding protein